MSDREKAQKKKLVYLACPYSHTDIRVRKEREHISTRIASHLMRTHGVLVFSPLTGNCPIENCPVNPVVTGQITYEDWMEIDLRILSVCNEMYILAIDGWRESRGIKEEIEFCKKHKIPIYEIYLDHNNDSIREIVMDI